MTLALWKRTMLSALVAMSVVGGSLTAFTGHASASYSNDCQPKNTNCGVPRNPN